MVTAAKRVGRKSRKGEVPEKRAYPLSLFERHQMLPGSLAPPNHVTSVPLAFLKGWSNTGTW